MAADLILPTAMWVEKEGAYGNAERRTHFWHQLVDAPGEARSDLWQLMEFSKRFTTDEVWPAEILAKAPEYRGKTLFDVLFAQRRGEQVPALRDRRRLREPRVQGSSASTSRRACSRNTPPSAAATATTSRPSTPTTGARPALAGGGRQGDALALPRGPRSLCREGSGLQFYGNPDKRANIMARALRAAGGSRPTRSSTSGSSPAGCWSTGTPAR